MTIMTKPETAEARAVVAAPALAPGGIAKPNLHHASRRPRRSTSRA